MNNLTFEEFEETFTENFRDEVENVGYDIIDALNDTFLYKLDNSANAATVEDNIDLNEGIDYDGTNSNQLLTLINDRTDNLYLLGGRVSITFNLESYCINGDKLVFDVRLVFANNVVDLGDKKISYTCSFSVNLSKELYAVDDKIYSVYSYEKDEDEEALYCLTDDNIHECLEQLYSSNLGEFMVNTFEQ